MNIYFSLYYSISVLLWNYNFAYIDHAWICSWNQPVLGNEGKFLAQGNKGSLWWGLNSQLKPITSQMRYQLHNDVPRYICLIIYIW